ncbi:hypothetical protein IWZ03DRAFT_389978 [Phyllosticta citriasiana]|uniref:Uncharacterized protein n=1 Tax=Phyllosticta citriasiana TaxID=595635 RepID=A0ABR1K865_9PEZI
MCMCVCVCMYVCMYACAMQRQCQKEKRTKSQSVLLLASPSESGAGRTTQVASHFASHSLDSQPLQSPSRSPNLLLFTCGLSLLPLFGPILPPLLSSPHLSPRLPLLPLHLRICPSSQGTQGGSADRHFSSIEWSSHHRRRQTRPLPLSQSQHVSQSTIPASLANNAESCAGWLA